jgi:hypothetical protein
MIKQQMEKAATLRRYGRPGGAPFGALSISAVLLPLGFLLPPAPFGARRQRQRWRISAT